MKQRRMHVMRACHWLRVRPAIIMLWFLANHKFVSAHQNVCCARPKSKTIQLAHVHRALDMFFFTCYWCIPSNGAQLSNRGNSQMLAFWMSHNTPNTIHMHHMFMSFFQIRCIRDCCFGTSRARDIGALCTSFQNCCCGFWFASSGSGVTKHHNQFIDSHNSFFIYIYLYTYWHSSFCSRRSFDLFYLHGTNCVQPTVIVALNTQKI